MSSTAPAAMRLTITFSSAHSVAERGSRPTYRPPECSSPWKRPVVPWPRSTRSTRIERKPRMAASRTTPRPVAPPPMTRTSHSSVVPIRHPSSSTQSNDFVTAFFQLR